MRNPLCLVLAVIAAVLLEAMRTLSLFWTAGTSWQAVFMTIILAPVTGSTGYLVIKAARRLP